MVESDYSNEYNEDESYSKRYLMRQGPNKDLERQIGQDKDHSHRKVAEVTIVNEVTEDDDNMLIDDEEVVDKAVTNSKMVDKSEVNRQYQTDAKRQKGSRKSCPAKSIEKIKSQGGDSKTNLQQRESYLVFDDDSSAQSLVNQKLRLQTNSRLQQSNPDIRSQTSTFNASRDNTIDDQKINDRQPDKELSKQKNFNNVADKTIKISRNQDRKNNTTQDSCLPQVITLNNPSSMSIPVASSMAYKTQKAGESGRSSPRVNLPKNLGVKHSLTTNVQKEFVNHSLNQSLTNIDDSVVLSQDGLVVTQNDSQVEYGNAAKYAIPIYHNQMSVEQIRKRFSKQNFMNMSSKVPKLRSSIASDNILSSIISASRCAVPISPKIRQNERSPVADSLQEMPDIRIKKHTFVNSSNSIQGIFPLHSLNNDGTNAPSLYKSNRFGQQKQQSVGMPYRMKTKLPFHDEKGIYQGVGKTPQICTQNTQYGRKLQRIESIEKEPKNKWSKNRMTVHAQSTETRGISLYTIDQNAVNEPEDWTGSVKAMTSKKLSTIEPKSYFINDEPQEYQKFLNRRYDTGESNQNDISGGRGNTALAFLNAPNDITVFKEHSPSMEAQNQNSMLSQKQGAESFQTVPHRLVQEVPFIEKVTNPTCQPIMKNQQSRSRLQTCAQTSPNKAAAFELLKLKNSESKISLSSAAECGMHVEIIQDLRMQVEVAEEEVRKKDRLISRLLDDEEEDLNEGKNTQNAKDQPDQTDQKEKLRKQRMGKLRDELDMAYKILVQRDATLNKMKKQSKHQVYTQCNEERIAYLNEVLKLQNLLKRQGGVGQTLKFVGVKVTQTQGNQKSRKGLSKSPKRTDRSNAANSPSKQPEKTEYISAGENAHVQSGSDDIPNSQASGPIASGRQKVPHSYKDMLRKMLELEQQIKELTEECKSKDLVAHEKDLVIHEKDLNVQEKEEEIKKKVLEVREKGDEIQKLLAERYSMKQNLKRKEELYEQIKSQHEKGSSENNQLSKELQDSKSLIEDLQTQIEYNPLKDTVSALQNQLEEEQATYEATLNDKDTQISTLNNEIYEMQTSNDDLQAIKASLESQLQDLKDQNAADMQQAKEQAIKDLEDLTEKFKKEQEDLTEKLKKEQEEALKLQSQQLTELHEAALIAKSEEVSKLKEEEFNAQLQNLKEDHEQKLDLVQKDFDTQFDRKQKDFQKTEEIMQKEIDTLRYELRKSVMTNQISPRNSTRQSLVEETAAMMVRLEDTEAKAKQAKEKKKQAKHEVKMLSDMINTMDGDPDTNQPNIAFAHQIVSNSKEMTNLKAQVEEMKVKLEEAEIKTAQIEDLQAQLVEMSDHKAQVEEMKFKLEEAEAKTAQIEDLQAQLLAKTVPDQSLEIEELKLKIKELERELQKSPDVDLVAENANLVAEKEKQASLIEQLKLEVERLKLKIKELEQELQKSAADGDLSAENERLASLIDKLTKETQETEELKVKIKKLEEMLQKPQNEDLAAENARQATLIDKLMQEKQQAEELSGKISHDEPEKIESKPTLCDASQQTIVLMSSKIFQPEPESPKIEKHQSQPQLQTKTSELSKQPSVVLDPEDINSLKQSEHVEEVIKAVSSAKVIEVPPNVEDIADEDVDLDPADTIESVQKEVHEAIRDTEWTKVFNLRAKERVLLKQEIIRVSDTLKKKNELINETLESQERLTQNAVQQRKQIEENNSLMEESRLKVKEMELQLQLKDDKMLRMSTEANKMTEQIQGLETLSRKRLKGLKEVVRVSLQEQFLAYRVCDIESLEDMMQVDPTSVMEVQFMVPQAAQKLFDCSASSIFNLMDARKLSEVTQVELELGFRKLKEAFERESIDYKTYIFEVDTNEEVKEEEQDADDVRLALSEDSMAAIPLMREEFIQRVNDRFLNDYGLAEKIAIGCQQVARSVCFVHYWAFNALWLSFHSVRDTTKLTMKQLLEQAAKDQAAKEEKIAELERQKQEAEKALEERKKVEDEAERIKKEAEEAQIKYEEEIRRRELELAQVSLLKDKEAKTRDEELAEAARLREEEAKKWEKKLAEAVQMKEEEVQKSKVAAIVEAALIRDEEGRKRKQALAEAERLKQEVKKREQEMAEAVQAREEEAKRLEWKLTEAARIEKEQLTQAARIKEQKMAEAARIEKERFTEVARIKEWEMAEAVRIKEYQMAEAVRIKEREMAQAARVQQQQMAEAARVQQQQMAESARFRHQQLEEAARLKEEELVEQARIKEQKLAEVTRANEEELRRVEREMAEAVRLKEEEARQREQQLAEAVKLKEEEAKKQVQQLTEEAKKREQELTEEAKNLVQKLAEEARQREQDLSLEAQRREQELKGLQEEAERHKEEARLREAELLKKSQEIEEQLKLKNAQLTKNIEDQGENGDREGFSCAAYRLIKRDKDLGAIVSVANASHYDIRTNCSVYVIDSRHLIIKQSIRPLQELPFATLTKDRNAEGQTITDEDYEVDVILKRDFFDVFLRQLGLQKYADVPVEKQKIEILLTQIGAIATHAGSQHQLIKVEVLMGAMLIHGYEHATRIPTPSSPQRVDLRKLSSKSIRILNRLTRILNQYLDKYQQKAKPGTTVSINQIIKSIFKGQLDTKMITRSDTQQIDARLGSEGVEATPQSANESQPGIKMQIIKLTSFYATLCKLRIKKNAAECSNLSRFLKQKSAEFQDSVNVKFLLNVVEEFQRSHYTKTFGSNKKRLVALLAKAQMLQAIAQNVEEEEYYYDEEDEEAAAKHNDPFEEKAAAVPEDGDGHNSVAANGPTELEETKTSELHVPPPIQSDSLSKDQQPAHMMTQPDPVANQGVDVNQADEYGDEYYDEEEDGEEANVQQQQPQQMEEFKKIPVPQIAGTSRQQNADDDFCQSEKAFSMKPTSHAFSGSKALQMIPSAKNVGNRQQQLPHAQSILSGYQNSGQGLIGQSLNPSELESMSNTLGGNYDDDFEL